MKNRSLVELLELEQIDDNLFRGQNFPTSWGVIFGGQILAQSLHAAGRTVADDRTLHSMHAYFILPGKMDTPVIFHVDRIRDGRSFTTRRVVAVQHGTPIFNMSCSFQIAEEGLEHRDEMPEIKHHSELLTDLEMVEQNDIQIPPEFKRFLSSRFFSFKPVHFHNPFQLKSSPPSRSIWLKCSEEITDTQAFHQEALAFVSDFNLLTTATLPHGDRYKFGQLQMASLDHAMWLHRPFRVNEWLLYHMDSPSASNSRGVNFGKIFSEDGVLVATVAQEGLMRVRG